MTTRPSPACARCVGGTSSGAGCRPLTGFQAVEGPGASSFRSSQGRSGHLTRRAAAIWPATLSHPPRPRPRPPRPRTRRPSERTRAFSGRGRLRSGCKAGATRCRLERPAAGRGRRAAGPLGEPDRGETSPVSNYLRSGSSEGTSTRPCGPHGRPWSGRRRRAAKETEGES
jgi:hypothetical protein